MADTKKSKSFRRFFLGMLIYGIVFLVIAAVGLGFFWKFIEAYELSRPKTAVDEYTQMLRPENLLGDLDAVLDQVDTNLQSRESCEQWIRETVAGPFRYAKKSRESSAERQVYAFYSGDQLIGEAVFAPLGEASFGFTQWVLESESFDLSYLIREPVSVTVPQSYQVSVNGTVLDETYITQSDIPFTDLQEFHGDIPMCTMVTYTTGRVLGQPEILICNESGEPVTITDDTDMNGFIPVCSEEYRAELNDLVDIFLSRYAAFTGSSNRAPEASYMRLVKLLVPNGELAERLKTALDGLQFAQSYGDTVLEYQINHMYHISEGRYMCDVTYVLQTYGKKGAVQTINNMKLIYLETSEGLKVEAMTLY